MKKYLLILLFIISGSFSILKAQVPDEETRAEKIQSLKIAFITQKLQLTPDEAQKFWPVYNQYDKEVHSIESDNDPNHPPLYKEEKLLDTRKKYLGSFEKILGQDKTNRLFNAEKDFRGLLIRRLQNRNPQRFNQLHK
ncbi:MAG TPA: hypothetical protein VNS50_08190 [Ginsengibacter sp.]|nr:hypothetical protein [Ginsengibacter sp.]